MKNGRENDLLGKLETEANDLAGRLQDIRSKVEKERTARAPEQAAVTLKSIEDFFKLFRPGGIVPESFGAVRENLKILHGYNGKYAQALVSDDRYGLPQTPEVRYICENLLSGPLHQKAKMWDVLLKVAQNRKAEGNPLAGGE